MQFFEFQDFLQNMGQLLFLIIIIIGIFLLYKYATSQKDQDAKKDQDPISVAKARLASGAITQEEYSKIIKELKN